MAEPGSRQRGLEAGAAAAHHHDGVADLFRQRLDGLDPVEAGEAHLHHVLGARGSVFVFLGVLERPGTVLANGHPEHRGTINRQGVELRGLDPL